MSNMYITMLKLLKNLKVYDLIQCEKSNIIRRNYHLNLIELVDPLGLKIF